ncbi:MAG: acyl-CoA/acyl-ACP dehydrogenase [Firmicutes bacterium]|jgi:alkylation response protein AidB-like acyl-CoA dehydrogenase|nr:acyl-CoA/acyl-ACP dehydrogenase [Bacillota bacterium]
MSLNLYSKPIGEVNEEIIEKAKEFAENKIAPFAASWEKDHVQPRETLSEAIKLFCPLAIDESDGGYGYSKETYVLVLEELAKADYGFTFALAVHNHTAFGISLSDNKEVKDKYLKKLMTGEMIGAFLLTEPECGSDASSVTTSATEENGVWTINGRKSWITNAHSADLLMTYVQTGEGYKGISTFAIETNSSGVSTGEQYDMVGAHAMVTGEVIFDDVKVDNNMMVYPIGKGFSGALRVIDGARLCVAAMNNGAYMGCLETGLEYVRNRVQFKKPLVKNQSMSFAYADRLTELEASRMLTFQAAKCIDEDENTLISLAHCKKYSAINAYNGISYVMRSMGANGLLRKDYPIVRQLSGVAISFNTDGTSDILNIVIGRQM